MEEKKSPKANLENKKLMFTQIGLIIGLLLAWGVFEIKSYDKREFSDVGRTVEIVEEEMVEITKQEQKPQPVEVPKQT
ncbi:MAG: energy transducer TonB, partial [Bacteroidales bacterium]|nr:energy transducer TonB [Bacteroidales bacterium]